MNCSRHGIHFKECGPNNQNKTQTTIANSKKEFHELSTCPGMLTWHGSVRDIRCIGELKNVNVVVVAYVTTRFWLKVYEYLSKFGQCSVL